MLLLVATALGFIYTAATEKGMFVHRPAPPPTTSGSLVSPGMISRDQAQRYFEAGTALFLDARHEFDYQLGHIRGAINIPLRMYETRKTALDTIPKDRLLIAYCDGANCNSSIELSAKLAIDGYTGVKIFFGGWQEWTAANLPVDKKP